MRSRRDEQEALPHRSQAASIRPRWLLLVCGLLAVMLVIQLGSRMRFVPQARESEPARVAPQAAAPVAPAPARPKVDLAGPLSVPVAGIGRKDLYDSYTDARSGGRIHDAIDILAPHGTPVVAAAAGRVEKLFVSDLGGNTIYIRSPDGQSIYYYAHLSGYRRGLHEGETVARGALIGAVGSSGNADASAPHLHFAIHHVRTDESWDGGVPVNPYPLLMNAR